MAEMIKDIIVDATGEVEYLYITGGRNYGNMFPELKVMSGSETDEPINFFQDEDRPSRYSDSDEEVVIHTYYEVVKKLMGS